MQKVPKGVQINVSPNSFLSADLGEPQVL